MARWLNRVAATAAALAVSACGGSTREAVVERPDLTAPPGEMATQRLVLIRQLGGEAAGKAMGNISLSTETAGVLVRVDLRNAPAGEFVLTLNENPDCRADEVDGAVVYGAKAGPAWGPEGGQVRMPSLQATPEGAIKAEFLIRGLAIADTRDRSFVLTAGGRRVACGISI